MSAAALLVCVMSVPSYAAGWQQEGNRWRYSDESADWYNGGWYWIDGDHDGRAECYYFDGDGYMAADEETPDGYRVDASGAWVVDGRVQVRNLYADGPGAVKGAEQSASGGSQVSGGSASGSGGLTAEQIAAGPGAVPKENASDPASGGASDQPISGRVIDPSRPMVALTYDDGPQTTAGNRIMDCLARYDAKATFFVVGDRCASRASEMQRMAAEGHEIGNHTYQHKYLNKLDAAQIRYQIEQGRQAVTDACGVSPALVRLPGGNKNDTVLANVAYPMIMWSVDTRDWATRNTQSTVSAVLNSVRDGDIVLMHELYESTAEATEQIVPELIARGYQLVTVSELAQARGIPLEPGKLYYNFR